MRGILVTTASQDDWLTNRESLKLKVTGNSTRARVVLARVDCCVNVVFESAYEFDSRLWED